MIVTILLSSALPYAVYVGSSYAYCHTGCPMLPSDQDAVPAFPLRLIRFPILAEAIDFVFSDRLYSAFFPCDIASAVTMYLLCFFLFLLARSVSAKSRTHPFRPLCREIGFSFLFSCFFLSLRGFLFRCCPHCLSEPHRAVRVLCYYPPVRFSIAFRTFKMLRALTVGRVIFSCLPLRFSTRTFQPMVYCSTSLRLFCSCFDERRRCLEFCSSLSAFRLF